MKATARVWCPDWHGEIKSWSSGAWMRHFSKPGVHDCSNEYVGYRMCGSNHKTGVAEAALTSFGRLLLGNFFWLRSAENTFRIEKDDSIDDRSMEDIVSIFYMLA